MIGLPSGLERVRWKRSAISPQPSITPRIFAPRALRDSQAFEHQRAGAFRHHEAVAVLGERLGAACGGSFGVDSAESSEKRISDSGLTEPSVPMHSAASVSPRRIASTPSWIAVAPDAQAVDSEIGEPLVPNLLGQRCRRPSRTWKRSWKSRELPGCGGAQQVVVARSRRWRREASATLAALRPFDLDRRDREEQRAGEIAAAADAGLRDRFLGRRSRRAARDSAGARQRLDRHEVDGAGDAWSSGRRSRSA